VQTRTTCSQEIGELSPSFWVIFHMVPPVFL
jgi:hypothetical protein